MIYFNLLLIAIIAVCIIDLSGFIDSLKYGISYILTKGKLPTTSYNLKPISCSLCMTHWLGFFYLLIIGEFSLLTYAILLLISISTPLIKDMILLILDIITTIINKINSIL